MKAEEFVGITEEDEVVVDGMFEVDPVEAEEDVDDAVEEDVPVSARYPAPAAAMIITTTIRIATVLDIPRPILLERINLN